VLLLSNARKNVEKETIRLALFTANYKEEVTSRDAATGRVIAESDFFEPLTPGSLITPAFGGRVYFPIPARDSSPCRSCRQPRHRRGSEQACRQRKN